MIAVRWERIALDINSGHKYFSDRDSEPDQDREPVLPFRVAIADASGKTPDRTDDGVLYLDRKRHIQLDTSWRGTALIPLVCPEGRELATPTSHHEAMAVAKQFGMTTRDPRRIYRD